MKSYNLSNTWKETNYDPNKYTLWGKMLGEELEVDITLLLCMQQKVQKGRSDQCLN